LRARFEPARIETSRDQWHAYNTFYYAIGQDERHELALDPEHEGSCLPDLLGLRVIAPWLSAHVRTRLPRVERARLVALLPPGALDTAKPVNLDVLAEAAAAALAVPDSTSRSWDAVRARRAAVHAVGAEISSARLADCLGLGVRNVQILRAQPPETELVRAVAGQARLRSALRALPGVDS
jgi:hypothetical protein